MNCSDRRSTIRFFAGAAVVFLIFAALQGILRQTVDLTNAARRPLGDRTIIPETLAYREGLAAQWLRNTASSAASATWVIGSSISLYGIDPCDFDTVSNYSRPTQNLHEVSAWLPGALARNKAVKHVAIEVSIGTADRNARSERTGPAAKLAGIFDGERLWLSVKHLLSRWTQSGTGAPAQRVCAPRLHFAWRKPAAKEVLPDPGFTKLSIADAVAAVAPWCAAAKGNAVTFFLPPVFDASVIDAAETETGFAYRGFLRTEFDNQARDNPGCDLTFVDLSAEGLRDRSVWYDQRHYRPEFGVQLVSRYLSQK